MNRFMQAIDKFRSDTRGGIAVEAVLMLPLMVWVFIFFTVYWDAYRVQNLAQKATFTVADALSRERGQIVPNTAKTYLRVFNYAAEVPGNPNVTNYATSAAALRITSVTFSDGEEADDPDDDQVSVAWSVSSDTARLPMLTNTTIAAIKDRIPALIDGDSIIVVESRLRWQPKFTSSSPGNAIGDTGGTWFTYRDIDTLAAVRPRFVPKLCFNNVGVTAAGSNVACEL